MKEILYQLIAFAVNAKFHSIQALQQKNASPSSLWAIRQMSSLLRDIFNTLRGYFATEHKRLVLWNMPLEMRSSHRVISSATSAFLVFESVIRAALCKYWNKVHLRIGRGHNPSSHLLMGSWLTPLLITLILLHTQAEKVILQYEDFQHETNAAYNTFITESS